VRLRVPALLVGLALVTVLPRLTSGQQTAELPHALTQMIATERAFAARALIVGWKTAFLEYFANDAVGFTGTQAGYARDQIAANPDPPPDHQLIWEPRVGDVAASGELGYLTGPSRNILPSRNGGRPRHGVYASVWKRQRDESFRVIIDPGTDVPSAAPFATGFVRAPSANRFTGDYDDTTPPLSAADGILNSALRSGQAAAYRGRLAEGARFHRPNLLPVVGERNVSRYLASQPAYAAADSRHAEAARSGDLGYTWGTYTLGPARNPTQRGHYVRIWVRERNGQWKIAMDITQPAASR
jgi:ketosteroid isomerase-like protein